MPEDDGNSELKPLKDSFHEIEDFIKFNLIKVKSDLSKYKRYERNGKVKQLKPA